jgi:twinkle protein
MNTKDKPDPLAAYGGSRMDAAQVQVATPLPAGTYCELADRRIGQSTCRLYDYQVALHHGRPAHFAHIKDQQGRNVATHIRILPKQITWKGSPKGTQLFGQHLGSGSHLIITEGEIDAMSVHEAYCARTKGVVAVSITSGVNACLNNLKANLKYINSFNRVTVFFDDDRPTKQEEEGKPNVGQEWAAKAVELIGPKARLATGLGYKDANEAWQALDGDAIRRAIDNATKHTPEGVVQAVDLLDAVLNPEEDRGIDTPWKGWDAATEGYKPGELWLIAGGTGIGKSLFTRSMALDLASNGTKVAYIGLEEKASTTLERMLSEKLGVPFHLQSTEVRNELKAEVTAAMKQFAPNLLLLDKFGSESMEAFVSTVKHYVLNEECRVVFLDHFSLLADGIALNVDQRRAIDKAIKDLKTLAMELGFTFVVVCHLSRAQGMAQSHEEGGEPKLSELRGSHSLAQIPDYIWMLARNPLDTEQPNTTSCWLKKNRIKGEVGMMSKLEFLPKVCRFKEEFARTPS